MKVMKTAYTIEELLSATDFDIVGITKGERINPIDALEIVKGLKLNPAVTELNLSCNTMDKMTISILAGKYLQNNKNIKVLNLSHNTEGYLALDKLNNLLHKNETIETLRLSNNNLKDDQAYILADNLLTNKSIANLDLSDNNIGIMGGNALMDLLNKNKVLKINIKDNYDFTEKPLSDYYHTEILGDLEF